MPVLCNLLFKTVVVARAHSRRQQQASWKRVTVTGDTGSGGERAAPARAEPEPLGCWAGLGGWIVARRKGPKNHVSQSHHSHDSRGQAATQTTRPTLSLANLLTLSL